MKSASSAGAIMTPPRLPAHPEPLAEPPEPVNVNTAATSKSV